MFLHTTDIYVEPVESCTISIQLRETLKPYQQVGMDSQSLKRNETVCDSKWSYHDNICAELAVFVCPSPQLGRVGLLHKSWYIRLHAV